MVQFPNNFMKNVVVLAEAKMAKECAADIAAKAALLHAVWGRKPLSLEDPAKPRPTDSPDLYGILDSRPYKSPLYLVSD